MHLLTCKTVIQKGFYFLNVQDSVALLVTTNYLSLNQVNSNAGASTTTTPKENIKSMIPMIEDKPSLKKSLGKTQLEEERKALEIIVTNE